MPEKFSTLRARLAAHEMHARHDSKAVSQPARDAFMRRFARQVREDAAARGEKLSAAEVDRRAEHLKTAHFTRMALASAKARRRRKARS